MSRPTITEIEPQRLHQLLNELAHHTQKFSDNIGVTYLCANPQTFFVIFSIVFIYFKYYHKF